ncbi:retrovirus-related pol polyprotein from transposon TNT 1-94 [Tanacetum coccineum]
MGLWYPKDSGFELTAFSDADHAGCLDTRKSTSGGIQFLEAEYVALSASCAQVMWMRTQLQDYGFNYNKKPAVMSYAPTRTGGSTQDTPKLEITSERLPVMRTKVPSMVNLIPQLRKTQHLSWKPCQGDSLNLPDHRIHKDGDGDASFQLKSDSLPHAHAQSTKTFYKHQDSRIMKAQELKTKTSAQTLIYKIFLQRYQVYQGRLLASFQDDAKYEHVGQDTRSQGGKDDQDKQGKDLKISDIKTKSKDNDKGSRSKITKHEGTSLQRIQRPSYCYCLGRKAHLLEDKQIPSVGVFDDVSLKILSRTRKFVHN